MRCGHVFYAANNVMAGNAPEIDVPELREFWRELARLITFFGLDSP